MISLSIKNDEKFLERRTFLSKIKLMFEETSFRSFEAKIFLSGNISLFLQQKNNKICFEKELKIKNKIFLIF
jgi:hypothetical protein